MKRIFAFALGASLLGSIEPGCRNSEKTREIATADYVLENYRWFKNQSAAIEQTEAQIASMKGEIADYVDDFESVSKAEWPFDAREELGRKETVLRGYISQYNMLVKDYNARSSDMTRNWTKGDTPQELEPFLKEYKPLAY